MRKSLMVICKWWIKHLLASNSQYFHYSVNFFSFSLPGLFFSFATVIFQLKYNWIDLTIIGELSQTLHVNIINFTKSSELCKEMRNLIWETIIWLEHKSKIRAGNETYQHRTGTRCSFQCPSPPSMFPNAQRPGESFPPNKHIFVFISHTLT